MAQPLVIVESPAKARTIAGYLGDDYVVESSIGHVRDLPRNAADVPKAYKGESWARLGVDTENDFKPLYVVSSDKKDHVRHLKALLAEADELYLATDEDREGEAIAWHLLEVLNPGPNVTVKRMVFHEITPTAIQAAIDSPREIDRRMVDAQEARRILDRLYGYEVSPVLWKKVMPQLSAGRVQSVATRIVVERERERMAFIAASYWDIAGTFSADDADVANFGAKLNLIDGVRLATGRDFDETGKMADGVVTLDEAGATGLVSALEGAAATVTARESKPYRRRPAAPFMTSTLQQEGGRKLRMSSRQVMQAAQSLYEAGFITYMRTDSTTLSETALAAARSEVTKRFGDAFVPDAPREYKKKVKNAQEAHEAIRPAGDTFQTPEAVAAKVSKGAASVYDLIWKRTIASQMTDATGETVTLRLGADASDGRRCEFSTSGTVIGHLGHLKIYTESSDESAGAEGVEDNERDKRLPPLEEGDRVGIEELSADGHETQPPSRYTEASLVKRLEELGVGRPSTYAAIMSTIQDRGYVWKKGSAMVPSFTAFSVVNLMENHFPNLVDYAFTAKMEDDLDEIASGSGEAVPWLNSFYFGEGGGFGLKELVGDRITDIDAKAVNTIPIGVDANGVPVAGRVGRYGPYLERGEDRASIPEDLAPDELTIDKAIELIEAPSGDRVLGTHPETGIEIEVKAGRFGPYIQMGEHDDETGEKPATASLFKSMSVETLTLEEAVELLKIPRVVGVDPADGEEIAVYNGRYGPYVKKGKESRSLESEEELLTIDLQGCLTALAQPKRRRGQTPKPPLRELGEDTVSGNKMVIKDGRFGPYVTDGETNASLRKGDEVEDIDDMRASELLQMRRDRGPAKKKTKKKATKKKTAAKKKTGAKKAAAKKKTGAKKTAGKKDGAADTASNDTAEGSSGEG